MRYYYDEYGNLVDEYGNIVQPAQPPRYYRPMRQQHGCLWKLGWAAAAIICVLIIVKVGIPAFQSLAARGIDFDFKLPQFGTLTPADQCSQAGGIWISVGGQGSCSVKPNAEANPAKAAGILVPGAAQQSRPQQAPHTGPQDVAPTAVVIAPTSTPEPPTPTPTPMAAQGAANCAYPLDVRAWVCNGVQASPSDVNLYIATYPYVNPWEVFMKEKGCRPAQVDVCPNLIPLPVPQDTVASTDSAAMPSTQPAPKQPDPVFITEQQWADATAVPQSAAPPPTPAGIGVPSYMRLTGDIADAKSLAQLIWIFNKDPKPYSLAPQMQYMGFGSQDALIADMKNLAASCQAGTPAVLNYAISWLAVDVDCDNVRWQMLVK